MPFTLSSASFRPEAEIPARHTCEGEDVAPPLAWSGAPNGVESYILIVDDPDAPDPRAPKRVWVHWVVYNIPGDVTSLPAGVGRETLPQGAREGLNDWKRTGWSGPCPPIGRHRYFFKLFALDTLLEGVRTPTKADLEQAMRGHVLASTELMGTYEKKGR